MIDIEDPQITMANATGYPTKEHSDWEIKQELVEDHPVEDACGTEIKSGDQYFEHDGFVVLVDNLEDFCIEVLGLKPLTAK